MKRITAPQAWVGKKIDLLSNGGYSLSSALGCVTVALASCERHDVGMLPVGASLRGFRRRKSGSSTPADTLAKGARSVALVVESGIDFGRRGEMVSTRGVGLRPLGELAVNPRNVRSPCTSRSTVRLPFSAHGSLSSTRSMLSDAVFERRRWACLSLAPPSRPSLPHGSRRFRSKRDIPSARPWPAREGRAFRTAREVGFPQYCGVLSPSSAAPELGSFRRFLVYRQPVVLGFRVKTRPGGVRVGVFGAVGGVRERAVFRRVDSSMPSLYLPRGGRWRDVSFLAICRRGAWQRSFVRCSSCV